MKVYTCEKCAKGTAGCTKKSDTVSICPSFVSYAKAALLEQQRKKIERLSVRETDGRLSVIPSHLTYKPFANIKLVTKGE